MNKPVTKDWSCCPSCGQDLDTGWECEYCELDWLPYAYPWHRRIKDRIRIFVFRIKCWKILHGSKS